MSMFLCPLCGLQVSLARYDPSGYVNDVIGIEKVSLGRGRGFEEVDRYSLLDTDLPALRLLKIRVSEIHDFLFDGQEDRADALELEMEEILAKINNASNTDYEILDEAVDFLLARTHT